MSGHVLTDAQWARIEPLLPDHRPKRGGRWRDHRGMIDAIAFKFQTGTQWVHLPEKYGNWRGVYNRLRMWAVDGTWERVRRPPECGHRGSCCDCESICSQVLLFELSW
ncbi:transposase [Streptomyces sp900105755]|uniref:transposase n=1 Tax=Streptomyces sp. 900105755 TaxID=3154389 RepID=UPI003328202D